MRENFIDSDKVNLGPGEKTICSFSFRLNMSYLTDSYIVFNLKMESVSKNSIFGLKMMVKSGLDVVFFKFLHAGDLLHKSVQNHKFSNKNNHLPAWRDFKINLSRPLFTVIFRPKMIFLLRFHFEGKNDGCLTAL